MRTLSNLAERLFMRKKETEEQIRVAQDTIADPTADAQEKLESAKEALSLADSLSHELAKVVQSEPYANMKALMSAAQKEKDPPLYSLNYLFGAGFLKGPDFVAKYLGFAEGEIEDKLAEGHISFINEVVTRGYRILTHEDQVQQDFNTPNSIGQWGENLPGMVKDVEDQHGTRLPKKIEILISNLNSMEQLFDSHAEVGNVSQALISAVLFSVSDMGSKLVSVQSDIKKREEERDDLKGENEDWRTQNAELETKNRALLKDNQASQEENDRLTEQNRTLKDDNSRLERSQKDMEVTNKALKEQYDALNTQVDAAKKLLESINKLIDATNRTVDRMGRRSDYRGDEAPTKPPAPPPLPEADEKESQNGKDETQQINPSPGRQKHHYKCPHCQHVWDSTQEPPRWKGGRDIGRGNRFIKCTACHRRFNVIPQLKAEAKKGAA